jgi:hypothetical protein
MDDSDGDTPADGSDATEDADDDRSADLEQFRADLEELEDGGGCQEVWEYLSAHRHPP